MNICTYTYNPYMCVCAHVCQHACMHMCHIIRFRVLAGAKYHFPVAAHTNDDALRSLLHKWSCFSRHLPDAVPGARRVRSRDLIPCVTHSSNAPAG